MAKLKRHLKEVTICGDNFSAWSKEQYTEWLIRAFGDLSV
jgi:hypothetical protein